MARQPKGRKAPPSIPLDEALLVFKRHLAYRAVCETGSLRAAAPVLGVTRKTLTSWLGEGNPAVGHDTLGAMLKGATEYRDERKALVAIIEGTVQR